MPEPVDLNDARSLRVKVDAAGDLIFSKPRAGWRGAISRWLRAHWTRYRELEGEPVQFRGTVKPPR